MKSKQRSQVPDLGLLAVKQIPVTQLPVRSKPLEYLPEFKTACISVQPGHAVEIDSQRVDEHRARKYLELLSSTEPSFKRLVLRTGTNHQGGRRRVFIVRPVDANGDGTPAELEADK